MKILFVVMNIAQYDDAAGFLSYQGYKRKTEIEFIKKEITVEIRYANSSFNGRIYDLVVFYDVCYSCSYITEEQRARIIQQTRIY